ncbi:MAG: hypothetical protein IKA53_04505 [Clostridia bacterium]|nr:hypothetical protein [Clostridia bacterium]
MKTKRRFSAPRRKYGQTGHPTNVKRIAAYKEFFKKMQKAAQRVPTIKQFLLTANTTKGVRAILSVLLFTLLALQGVVCYTL